MIRVRLSQCVSAAGQLLRWRGTGRKNETFRLRDAIQHFGFASCPPDGAEGILIAKGNTYILIGSDDRRYRVELLEGEAALFNNQGDFVKLGHDRKAVVSAGAEVTLITPVVNMRADTVNITGNLHLDGDLSVGGKADVTGIVKGLEVQTAVGTHLGTHVHPTAPTGPISPPTPGT